MKYKIHKEGFMPIAVALILSVIAFYALWVILTVFWLSLLLSAALIILIAWLVYFFRVPDFPVKANSSEVISAADGKVVAIETMDNKEFPGGRAWQISVFMSPLDTHLNRFPVPGKVDEIIYKKGKFLPAFNPKSSELNERNTVKMTSDHGEIIWIRQIAGIMARRIVNYAKPQQPVYTGEPLGFIKLGSRVDLFIPSTAGVKVKIGQKVKAGRTVMASL